MTTRQDPFLDRLEAWLLEDDGAVLSEHMMDGVVGALDETRQVGAGWSIASLRGSPAARVALAVSGVAAVGLLVVVLGPWFQDLVEQPSPTPQPSGSPSADPSVVPTPSPSDAATGLDVGGVGIVVATEPLVLRSAPGTGPDSAILDGQLWPGMRFAIIDGPVAASEYQWYHVRAGELEGWAAMASREGEPWLASVRNGVFAYGTPNFTSFPSELDLFIVEPGGDTRQIASLEFASTMDSSVTSGGGAVDCGPEPEIQWSPQGERLAVVVRSLCNGVVFTLDADGTDVVRHSDGQQVTWAPDGSQVAFGLNAPWFPCGTTPVCYSYPPGGWEVQVAGVSGGPPISLTESPAWVSATTPLWSPDGRTIAFKSLELSEGSPLFPNERHGVHLINADGSGQRFLTDGRPVRWSPDASSILVSKQADALTVEFWMVEVDGSGEIRLPVPSGGYLFEFSPDGQWIVGSGFLMRPDGSAVVPQSDIGFFANWSPDGREVVSGNEDGDIIATNLATGETRVLLDGSLMAFSPTWQPLLVVPTP